MKRYKTYNQNQMSLIPQTFGDLLKREHIAHFINDVVEEIDISEIKNVYKHELRGYPPYHPKMMLKILIYGYCRGVRSLRKISKKCEEDVAFRYLAANNFPKFEPLPTSASVIWLRFKNCLPLQYLYYLMLLNRHFSINNLTLPAFFQLSRRVSNYFGGNFVKTILVIKRLEPE